MANTRIVVAAFAGVTAEQVRIVAEREGWQMPLAPFGAGEDELTVVTSMRNRRR